MNPIRHCNSRIRLLVPTAFCLLVICPSLQAQVIGTWNFTNTTNGTSGTNNTVSIADFSAGVPSKSFNGGSEYYGQDGWPAGGINTANYIQFTLTPNSGSYLSILSITLRMPRSNTGSPSGSGPTAWSIRSSLDGYAADISSGTMTHNYANYNVYTGGGFGYIATSITFRVYGYNATISSGGNSRMVFDNIIVNGLGPILPVKLISFSAKTVNQSVQVNFDLANTESGSTYILERSNDGTVFTARDSKIESHYLDQASYSFTDNQFPANAERLYYRLKIVDPTGKAIYSSIVQIHWQQQSSLRLRLHDQSLTLYGTFRGDEQIALYNTAGHCLLNAKLPAGQMVHLATSVQAHSIYYLVLQTPGSRQSIAVMAE